MRTPLKIAFLIFLPYFIQGQTIDTTTQTIEGITDAMLEIISGPQGEERDWDRFRSLFLPTAQLSSLSPTQSGKSKVNVFNLEEFIRYIGPVYARDGFEEYALGLEVDEFNGIANVFQAFYCRNLIETYENKGINAYQLIYKDDRWWIANCMFTNESENLKLPEKYLEK